MQDNPFNHLGFISNCYAPAKITILISISYLISYYKKMNYERNNVQKNSFELHRKLRYTVWSFKMGNFFIQKFTLYLINAVVHFIQLQWFIFFTYKSVVWKVHWLKTLYIDVIPNVDNCFDQEDPNTVTSMEEEWGL